MKQSLEKLQKFFTLESERDYDNKAVMGGLASMLEPWQAEARAEGVSEDIIAAVATRLRDYGQLSPSSRGEALKGLWTRVRKQAGIDAPEEKTPPKAKPTRNKQTQSKKPPRQQKSKPPQAPPNPGKRQRKPKRRQIPEGPPAAMDASVRVLDGVGAKNAEKLARLGIENLGEMLYHFPRRYDDYSKLKPINRLEYGEEVTVIGTVQSVSSRPIRSGKSKLTEVIINDGSGALRASWFNQPWLSKSLSEGMQVAFAGKIEQYLGRLVMNNPEWEQIESEYLHANRIVPVYPLTAKLGQRWLRGQMNKVVDYWALRVEDYLPGSARKAADVMELPHALLQVHFPDSHAELRDARLRLAFDEVFLLQLGVLRQKKAWGDKTGRIFETSDEWLDQQKSRLPFELTNAQHKAVQHIHTDLASGHPMNRLLQGDVGSGKTVVAALGIGMVNQHDAQAALMAPTSILAEQHHRSLTALLAAEGGDLQPEQIRLLIGATSTADKKDIRKGLKNGEIKFVIGTHALIEDPVVFNDLQLIIIDEQHRFGVEQRAALRAKGDNPHLLVMTATPIPRSLALTVYGDLDLTVMDELPPGRLEVETHTLMPREIERAYTLINKQLEEGRQAFIIYPLVEESENSDSKAAVEEQARLQDEIFPNYKVGLLHGRLKPEEKEKVMRAFSDGKYHILVSTSVVEVGVDVPNASVMLIEGANHFGLSQLHQFRGRVGRGEHKSYCLLVPNSNDDVENERLQAMSETNDGFVLAERDLKQRGPGQFLGTRQAGYSELKMASITNVRLIEKAREQAQVLINDDPDLTDEKHKLLAATLKKFWVDGRGDIS